MRVDDGVDGIVFRVPLALLLASALCSSASSDATASLGVGERRLRDCGVVVLPSRSRPSSLFLVIFFNLPRV